ncbi:CCA tRNA nucleotidyltransferase [Sulfurimonas sp.]|uniref:CCA tRNA nucleotidyltransferase n=1 Tax=Sulfurimonas sp. TaxID=2022749 RepID=UPI003D0C937D
MEIIDYPTELDIIFDTLKKSGIKPILVGGYVRDKLLNEESKDIDIELYGVSSLDKVEEILQKFGAINSVGKSFAVCKLKFEGYELDFSLPRKDNKTKSGHRGFDIEVYPYLDFKTAASRRDFTINAIGYDVMEKKIVDPFSGREDLKKRVLRAVDLESFGQDPLRVLRATQFCARFNLQIKHNLYLICKDMVSKNLLAELPKERIFEEIKKLLLKSQKPSIGLNLLNQFGFDFPTKNMFITDILVKKLTANEQTNLVLMLAALCYNFKQNDIELFLSKLTNEKELFHRVVSLVETHKKLDNLNDDYTLYKLATLTNIRELLIFSSSIYSTDDNSKMVKKCEDIYKKAEELGIIDKKLQPLLMGKDILKLGLHPSPKFSQILDDAYEAQMHGKFKNYDEALLWLKEYIKALSCQSL